MTDSCTRCGSEDLVRVGPAGSIETWRCRACGQTFELLVEYDDVFDPSDEPSAPALRLVGRWLTPPDKARLDALRRLAPYLTALSGTGDPYLADRFEIGRYTEDELIENDLEARLAELGVAFEPLPLARPPAGRS